MSLGPALRWVRKDWDSPSSEEGARGVHQVPHHAVLLLYPSADRWLSLVLPPCPGAAATAASVRSVVYSCHRSRVKVGAGGDGGCKLARADAPLVLGLRGTSRLVRASGVARLPARLAEPG